MIDADALRERMESDRVTTAAMVRRIIDDLPVSACPTCECSARCVREVEILKGETVPVSVCSRWTAPS